MYVFAIAIFFTCLEIFKDLSVCLAYHIVLPPTENTGSRITWYLPFQICSFLLIFLVIYSISLTGKKQNVLKLKIREISFLMIICISGFLFVFNVFAPGVIYFHGYFDYLLSPHMHLDNPDLANAYPWARYVLCMHNLFFHAFFGSFGLTLFFVNKTNMTNKMQLVKIIKGTCFMFGIIIFAAYMSCYWCGYPGDLSHAHDYGKVITCFFFSRYDTKVPIPIRSIMATCITLAAFSLWYWLLITLDHIV